jgi:hypothetical protein
MEGIRDSRAVGGEAVRRELEVARSGLPETFNESFRAGLIAFANRDAQSQFAVGLN